MPPSSVSLKAPNSTASRRRAFVTVCGVRSLIAATSSSVGRDASGRHVSATRIGSRFCCLQLLIERDLLRVHGAVVHRRQSRGDVPLELVFQRLQLFGSR